MKAIITMIMFGCVVGLIFTGSAVAGGEYGQTSKQQTTQMQGDMQHASKIIGMNVMDQQGNKLGSVDDLIFSQQGELDYLVLSSSEATGQGKLTPIPFDNVRDDFQVNQDQVNISISQSQLQSAPSFSQDELENLQQSNWQEKTRAYFEESGTTPMTEY